MAFFDRRKGASAAASVEAATREAGTAAPASIEGERGIPPVNPRGYQSRGQLFAISGGILALLGLMWVVNRPSSAPKLAPNDPRATREQRFDEGHPSGVIAPPEALASALEPPKPPAPSQDPIQVVPAIDHNATPGGTRGPHELTPLEKRMRSKTVIFDARSSRAGGAAREVPGFPGLRTDGSVADAETQSMLPSYLASSTALASAAAANQQQQPAAAGGAEKPAENDQNGVGAILRPTKLEGAAAARFPDRTLMIARGKLIDCTLDTAISTVVAGMTRCTLTRDVYGDDGKAVVLDRGTELTGEYRSNLRIGQARLGIVWSRAKTPGGVIIELDSPATDSLGRAGVDGYVDNHFWARYGAAILLSSLDDTLTLVTSRADRNQIYVPQNTSRTGRDAASVALEANVNIPPTIVKNQGEHVAVFVARDLDFRPVYSYRAPPIASNE